MPKSRLGKRVNLELASFIHQAALDPHLNINSLQEICDGCIHFKFPALCTNLIRVPAARKHLGNNHSIKLISLIGFPFGDIPNEIKISQGEWSAEQGADELEIVPNFLALQEGETTVFAEEIAQLASIGLPIRVILDMQRLSKEKLSLAIETSIEAGAKGIQTGNGFGPEITRADISNLTSMIQGRCSIKAVGKIKEVDQALELIQEGASEVGTTVGPYLMQKFKRIQQ